MVTSARIIINTKVITIDAKPSSSSFRFGLGGGISIFILYYTVPSGQAPDYGCRQAGSGAKLVANASLAAYSPCWRNAAVNDLRHVRTEARRSAVAYEADVAEQVIVAV